MPKLTAAQIKEQTKKIQDAIEKYKQQNKEEHFTSLTPEEIDKKLKRTNSPMIIMQGWSGAPVGGSASYTVGIQNPDPTSAIFLHVHVWVGSGQPDPVVGTFLLNVDTRFPRLTQPVPLLASGAFTTVNFTLKVPTTVEKTTYLGNSCLMRVEFHDIGQYLDRGSFPFLVT
jgi:hypothetical protein